MYSSPFPSRAESQTVVDSAQALLALPRAGDFFRDFPAKSLHCIEPTDTLAHKDSLAHCEPLTASFINHAGEIEPAFKVSDVRESDGRRPSPTVVGFGLNTLSERQAVTRLQRALSEAGQLIVRSRDNLVDVWFVGVGDPSRLFVEFHVRGTTEHPAKAGLCAYGEAVKLLSDMYQGNESWVLLESVGSVLKAPV